MWAIIMFFGFLGWGRIFHGLTKQKSNWETDGPMGLALLLLLGGPLMLAHSATGTTLMVIFLVGAGWFAFKVATGCKDGWWYPKRWVLSIPLVGVAMLILMSNVLYIDYNINDDLLAYFGLSQQIIQNGALTADPFSIRRAGAFGGFSLLQAAYHEIASFDNAWVLDQGIGKLLLAGLLVHLLKPYHNRVLAWGVGIVFLLISNGAFNTQSSVMITVLALFLGVLLIKSDMLNNATMGDLVALGIVAAGMASLRPTAGLLAALSILLCINRHTGQKVVIVGAISFFSIIPYSLMLYGASGTPALPPFLGYVDKESINFAPLTGHVGSLIRALTWMVNPNYIPLAIGLILIPQTTRPKTFGLIYLAAVATSTAIVFQTGEGQMSDTYRYIAPLLLPPFILCATNCVQSGRGFKEGLVVVVVLLACGSFETMRKQSSEALLRIPYAATGVTPTLLFDVKQYEAAQELMSPGDTFLSITDNYSLFNHARNTIYSIDLPGACSPIIDGKHMPLDGTIDEFETYLREAGVDAIVIGALNSPNTLNSAVVPAWNNIAKRTPPLEIYCMTYAKNYVAFFERIAGLKERNQTTMAGDFTVIHLKK